MKYLAVACFFAAILSLRADPVVLTVSAAASLRAPLEVLKVEFEKANPEIVIIYNFGSSGSLQRQILHGAPVDIFLSAAAKQMDELESAGLLVPESRFVLAGNSLVLIAPDGSAHPGGFGDLATVKTLAIGEPKSVPAGTYAMEILEYFGIQEALEGRMVFAKDVRQVLVYVESGNAEAGIVYGSDAAGSKAVRVVAVAPEDSHQKVAYPAAVIRASTHPVEAALFLKFLRSASALALFRSLGFDQPPAP